MSLKYMMFKFEIILIIFTILFSFLLLFENRNEFIPLQLEALENIPGKEQVIESDVKVYEILEISNLPKMTCK